MSKRVVRRFDYAKMPDGRWMLDNLGWLIGLVAAMTSLVAGSWWALRKPSDPDRESDGPSEAVEAAA